MFWAPCWREGFRETEGKKKQNKQKITFPRILLCFLCFPLSSSLPFLFLIVLFLSFSLFLSFILSFLSDFSLFVEQKIRKSPKSPKTAKSPKIALNSEHPWKRYKNRLGPGGNKYLAKIPPQKKNYKNRVGKILGTQHAKWKYPSSRRGGMYSKGGAANKIPSAAVATEAQCVGWLLGHLEMPALYEVFLAPMPSLALFSKSAGEYLRRTLRSRIEESRRNRRSSLPSEKQKGWPGLLGGRRSSHLMSRPPHTHRMSLDRSGWESLKSLRERLSKTHWRALGYKYFYLKEDTCLEGRKHFQTHDKYFISQLFVLRSCKELMAREGRTMQLLLNHNHSLQNNVPCKAQGATGLQRFRPVTDL